MKHWKYIVFALLGSVMVFHFGVAFYLVGRNYELTSGDYYAREMEHQTHIEAERAGAVLSWHYQFTDRGLTLNVFDSAGEPIHLEDVSLELYRPNRASLDLKLPLSPQPGEGYGVAFEPLPRGRWDLTIRAVREGERLRFIARETL